MFNLQSFNSLRRINLLLFAVFAICLVFFELQYHEFWKDEWQAWFIATDTSVSTFWDLLPGEGHPMLWFLILRVVSFAATALQPAIAPELVIQIIHLCLALACAWLFFLHFRFHPVIKAIVAPGYFFFFEYDIVNRGYILVILFLFALVPCLERPEKYRRFIPVILFLLCQTEVYGLFAAIALGLYFILISPGTGSVRLSVFRNLPVIISLLLGGALFLATLLPAESIQRDGAGIGEAFTALYSHTLAIAFDPPVPGMAGSGFFSLAFSLFLLGCVYMLLRKNKSWLMSYALFLILFLLFHALVYKGGPRQWGLHFIFLLFVLNFNVARRDEGLRFAAYAALLAIILPAQFFYGLKIIGKEKKYVFSNARDAGLYIREHIAGEVPVIGINKAYCTPVIGYSRHKFYSLPEAELFSYAIFRESMYLPAPSDLEAFYRSKRAGSLYVLSYRPLPLESFPKLQLIASFDKPSIREESYFLYRYIP